MAIKYTKEMIEFLKNIASGKSYVEIAHKFNEKFSLNLRVTAIVINAEQRNTPKQFGVFRYFLMTEYPLSPFPDITILQKKESAVRGHGDSTLLMID